MTNYDLGFIEKCAEMGIDYRGIVKQGQLPNQNNTFEGVDAIARAASPFVAGATKTMAPRLVITVLMLHGVPLNLYRRARGYRMTIQNLIRHLRQVVD